MAPIVFPPPSDEYGQNLHMNKINFFNPKKSKNKSSMECKQKLLAKQKQKVPLNLKNGQLINY